MAGQFTLGKDERLKSRKQIDELFAKAQKFSSGSFRVLYLVTENKTPLSFGVAVSNKNFKKAVDRNRIKRLTREAWRLQKNELKNELIARSSSLNLFLIYTAKALPVYIDVKENVQKILSRLLKNI